MRVGDPRAVDRRDGVFIDGELESARSAGDRNGIPLVKKDLILTTEDGSRDLMIPSPVAGYAEFMHDKTNGIRLWSGKPGDPSRELVGEVLHGAKGSSPFKEGEYVAYGAPLVRQSNAGTKGVHAHIEVEPAQFRTYLGDILNDRITAQAGHDLRGQANHGSSAPAMADGILKLGETNDAAIKQLQERLNALGVTDARGQPLEPDRDFGQRTKEAVEAFQRSHGILVDGKAGPETFKKLDEAEAEKQRGSTPAVSADAARLSVAAARDETLPVQAKQGLAAADTARAPVAAASTGIGLVSLPTPREHTVFLPATEEVDKAENQRGPIPLAAAGLALLSMPAHRDYTVYVQAKDGVEKVGGFGNPQQIERAAAALAGEARVSGLDRIDHVVPNGSGLFAVQGALSDPGHQRAYVDRDQATNQTVEQSTLRIAQLTSETQTQTNAQQMQAGRTV